MLIDAYARDFKEKVDICKVVGSRIGISKSTAKLVCLEAGENYSTLLASASNDADDMIKIEKLQKLGQTRYLAALHFKGLNRTRY